MKKTATLAALAWLVASAANAQDCADVTVEDTFDLDAAAIEALYTCLEAKMVAGYAKEGDEIASSYRDWQVTATRAAVQGAHGTRLC